MRRLITLILFVSVCLGAKAQTGIPRAQAMFIYNFSRLIEWPANYKTGPFVIGVVGSTPTLAEIETYALGKNVGSQPIAIKKFNSPSEISTCHILFVPFSKTKLLSEIIPAVQDKSTLIITEKNGAIDEGASINFVIIGDKLKFEIKPSNLTRVNIKVSSKLSEMAFKVY
ncbi:MAG: YfiR family protein [Bacteroidales bacterium]|nr:YfiR family protein [Bacteroidales bacterium]